MTPTNPTYLPIVHEFYAALKEADTHISVRVPWMQFSPREGDVHLPLKIVRESKMKETDKEKPTSRLELSQLPTAKYEVRIEPIKKKNEKELEEEEDLEEDSDEDL
ncbi:hypothetical protein J1N35_034542 [Gossypium stocksii]|uniref:Uncharacterized protein n=1 Tax=Gossypium stocksii TaxID=47602 RepID=A0A9D3US92_9ROSI|nr:hypothetical protein J1N35_034542 [Gossypium stocksii]